LIDTLTNRIVAILTTPTGKENINVIDYGQYDFGLSKVLREMDVKVDKLVSIPMLSEIIPLFTGLIEDITRIDFLLNNVDNICYDGVSITRKAGTCSNYKGEKGNVGNKGIIEELKGQNQLFNLMSGAYQAIKPLI
jgi:hypothetical protein